MIVFLFSNRIFATSVSTVLLSIAALWSIWRSRGEKTGDLLPLYYSSLSLTVSSLLPHISNQASFLQVQFKKNCKKNRLKNPNNRWMFFVENTPDQQNDKTPPRKSPVCRSCLDCSTSTSLTSGGFSFHVLPLDDIFYSQIIWLQPE